MLSTALRILLNSRKIRNLVAVRAFVHFPSPAKSIPVPTLAKSLKETQAEFDSLFPMMTAVILEEEDLQLGESNRWFRRALEYNVPFGKKNRGIAVVSAYKILTESQNVTNSEMLAAHAVGWAIEFLQAFFLMVDDVMDNSTTRRGKLCWYRQDGVGMTALNDAIMMHCGVTKLIHRFCRPLPCYADLLDLFNRTTAWTTHGQCLDMLSCPSGQRPDLSQFTSQRYDAIVKYKTSYYSFCLPVVAAMHMAGLTEESLLNEASIILLQLGHYFQIQDDYLDCYGDPVVTGKFGTDIADGKCTWFIVTALQKASDEQRLTLQKHYGSPQPNDIKAVYRVYEELGMRDEYARFEMKTSAALSREIGEFSHKPLSRVLTGVLSVIQGRNH